MTWTSTGLSGRTASTVRAEAVPSAATRAVRDTRTRNVVVTPTGGFCGQLGDEGGLDRGRSMRGGDLRSRSRRSGLRRRLGSAWAAARPSSAAARRRAVGRRLGHRRRRLGHRRRRLDHGRWDDRRRSTRGPTPSAVTVVTAGVRDRSRPLLPLEVVDPLDEPRHQSPADGLLGEVVRVVDGRVRPQGQGTAHVPAPVLEVDGAHRLDVDDEVVRPGDDLVDDTVDEPGDDGRRELRWVVVDGHLEVRRHDEPGRPRTGLATLVRG